MDQNQYLPANPQLIDAKVSWEIGDELINAVITAAVWSTERKPGTWQKMIEAAKRGAAGTKEGTVSAFLFRAMVDRLLEEFRAPGAPASLIASDHPKSPPSPQGGGHSTEGTPCR